MNRTGAQRKKRKIGEERRAGRWQEKERERKRERKRQGTLYETVVTRGSGIEEGSGSTGEKGDSGIRGVRGHGTEKGDAKEKEKRCVVVFVVVVRMDAIRVGDRTQCPSRSLATI